MIENITTATPAEIDIEIRRLTEKLAQISHRIATISAALDRNTLKAKDGYGMSDAMRDEFQADLEKLIDQQAVLLRERRPFNDEFTRRGTWTRYWIVTNGNGHIHWRTNCPRCFPTTEFYWLAEQSDLTHDELVELAGERACTTCFPHAPVAVRNRPSTILTPAEVERLVRAVERDAKREIKREAAAAKAICTPDGQPLRDSLGMVIKTEVTAQRYYVESAAEAYVWDPARGGDGPWGERPEHVPAAEWKVRQQENTDEAAGHAQRLLEALAAKRDTTVEEQRTLLEPKVRAYVKRTYKQVMA